MDASVGYASELDTLIGKWSSDDELALIVDRDGDRIFIRSPMNDTWRFEISNASAAGSTLSFIQKSFLTDGSAHPFNGVPCEVTIAPVAGDVNTLKYRIVSEDIPKVETGLLTRFGDDG